MQKEPLCLTLLKHAQQCSLLKSLLCAKLKEGGGGVSSLLGNILGSLYINMLFAVFHDSYPLLYSNRFSYIAKK